jgi:hypothetical protein
MRAYQLNDQRRIVPSKKARTRCGGAGQAIRTSQQTIDSALLIAIVTPLRGATPHAARGPEVRDRYPCRSDHPRRNRQWIEKPERRGMAPVEHSAGQQ